MTIRRSVLGVTLAGALSATLLAGCGSSSKPASGSTPAPSPTDLGGSVSSAISKASSAATSALSEISGGVDAAGDVSAGPVTIDSDGKAVSQLTVKNQTDKEHDYTISVSFRDSGGTVQDVVVLNVSKVPAHGQSTATAKSNRTLSGTLTAKVEAAVRH